MSLAKDTPPKTRKCPCSRKECIEEWNKMTMDGDDEDYGLWRHCEINDCHECYWDCKNGGVCNECGDHVCELHLEFADENEYEDEMICTDCFFNIQREGKIKF